MKRVYLDWNATAPLRPEARAAMLDAMDCLGNPSSVHAEGRAAKAIVEKARGQVAELVGCDRDEVVFTSGATEAALSVLKIPFNKIWVSEVEHDAIARATNSYFGFKRHILQVRPDETGAPDYSALADPFEFADFGDVGLHIVTAVNPETGILSDWQKVSDIVSGLGSKWMCDGTQAFGKIGFKFDANQVHYGICSAHKFGGPKGIGALIARFEFETKDALFSGGQEKGRRSGTENVVGIAGMGAAAEAAAKDLADGVWQIVEQNRNVFEDRLLNEVPELIIFGKDVERLPNTSYFAVPGWKAETQVMQMDLAGFAVSAGSACSSGKVKASRVLKAMGYDEITAGSAIRVSIGPSTTAQELESFADAWLAEYKRFKARREGK